MRIAYVTETYPPEVNDVSENAERRVRFLRECGHDVDVIRPHQAHEETGTTVSEWRTPAAPLPMYRSLRCGMARAAFMRNRFEQNKPVVVHLATPGPLAWTALQAARSMGLPVTTDFHTNFPAYSRYYHLDWLSSPLWYAMRAFHNHAARVFVPTVATRNMLHLKGFQNLEVIGGGVDHEKFHPRNRNPALRERLLPPESPLLLYVGRLAKEKSVDLALQAFEAVRAGMHQSAMVVIGDGPQLGILKKQYPLAHFVGNQSEAELARYYATADLLLFPSQTDTYGNAVLEALASGTPVLAYDMGAAAEFVHSGSSGRRVPLGEQEWFITAACAMAWQHRYSARTRAHARQASLTARLDAALTQFETSLMEVAYAIQMPATRQVHSA